MYPVFLVLAFVGAVCQQPVAAQHVAVAQHSNLVATNFAIPVATPVATVANPSLFYSYNAYAPQQAAQAGGADIYSQSFEERLAARIAAKIGASLEGGTFKATRALTIVDQHCAKCHAGPEPKGGFAVDLGPLTDAQKLKAIGRVLSDDSGRRMPKGEQLSAQELGRLIQFLSAPSITAANASKPAAENVPPPPPQP